MNHEQHAFDLDHEDLRPISAEEFRATIFMLLVAAAAYVIVMSVVAW
jgi:hypothetical protein